MAGNLRRQIVDVKRRVDGREGVKGLIDDVNHSQSHLRGGSARACGDTPGSHHTLRHRGADPQDPLDAVGGDGESHHPHRVPKLDRLLYQVLVLNTLERLDEVEKSLAVRRIPQVSSLASGRLLPCCNGRPLRRPSIQVRSGLDPLPEHDDRPSYTHPDAGQHWQKADGAPPTIVLRQQYHDDKLDGHRPLPQHFTDHQQVDEQSHQCIIEPVECPGVDAVPPKARTAREGHEGTTELSHRDWHRVVLTFKLRPIRLDPVIP